MRAEGSVAPAEPGGPEVSIIIPCRDEAETIGEVVRAAYQAAGAAGYAAEVLVVDNGSTDASAERAAAAGARVVRQPIRGYGAACLRGIEEARGEHLVFLDGDGTYDPAVLSRFVEPLRAGYEMVLGTRRNGQMLRGSMTHAHRHLLEPLQTHLLRSRFGMRVSDVRCGMRALSRGALQRMRMGATGMEFASEMLVEAVKQDVQVVEVPVEFRPRPEGGSRRTLEGGWRVARQILLLSPTRLYLVPGFILVALGLALELVLLPGPVRLGRLTLDFHFMFVGSACAILGVQLVLLGIYAKTYGLIHDRLVDRWIARFHLSYTLERGVALGGALFGIGVAVNVWILADWVAAGAGVLFAVRPAVLALTLMVLGAEVAFAAFFLSLLRGSEFGKV
jgi:hypothetical protein